MRAIHIGWLPLLAVLTAGAMIRGWINDPYSPTHDRDYGHNHEGALVQGLCMLAIEIAIAVAILRPWSYCRSWGRALSLSLLLVPWTMLATVAAMHAGSVFTTHALWLWLLTFIVGLMFVVSALASAAAHYASRYTR